MSAIFIDFLFAECY